MSYTAFQALVRRDLRLFFHGQARGDMSFVAPIADRLVLRLHLRRRHQDRPPSKIEVAVVNQDDSDDFPQAWLRRSRRMRRWR